ncbi:hypothetical protein ACIBHX_04975 [Nonomuraea sp. NPDC050536]|uniref:WXG100-like domain-containing protein n=1 Tax=Nonomuraea sp. NPDC050536 TaxID=3364366 RepID=UPI0037C94923
MGFDGCAVPGWLRPYVDWVTGMAWPEGDEHGCFRMADACVVAAHRVVEGTVAADPSTARLIGHDWDGAAQQAFAVHVAMTLGGKQAELVKRLIDAATALNGVGLTIQHAKRMITLIVVFLLLTLPLLIWRAPWLLRPFLQVNRLSALQIARNARTLMTLFAGFGGGMELLTQVTQLLGGRRDTLDQEQLLRAIRDGGINGLLTALLGGGLGRLATPALRAGVSRAEAAFAEKLLALLTSTAPGQMAQFAVTGAASTALSMAIDGQPLDWDMIVKSGTAAALGADGHHLSGHDVAAPRTDLAHVLGQAADVHVDRPRGHADEHSLTASWNSGVVHHQTIAHNSKAGTDARITLLQLHDGTWAVHKELVSTEARDAEYYGAKLKRVAGADVPPVIRVGDRAVVVGWADGTHLRVPWDGNTWHANGHERTASGVRTGLAYALTLDHDGKPAQIRIGEHGQVRSFDHDMAFRGLLPDDKNPFVRTFFHDGAFVDNPLTPGDVAQVRAQMAGFEAQMRADHRGQWFDNASTALEHIERHAKGTTPVFGLPPNAPVHFPPGAHQPTPHVPQPRSADLNPDTREPLLAQHGLDDRGELAGRLSHTIDPAHAAVPAQWAQERRHVPPVRLEDPFGIPIRTLDKRQLLVPGEHGRHHWVTELTVTLKYRTDRGVGPHELARLMSDAMDGVDLYFNYQHRLPDGSQLHVRLAFEEAPPGGGPYDHLRISPGSGRSMAGRWYVDTLPVVHAHELGHLLGLRDEYRDARFPERRTMTSPGTRATRSLMAGPYTMQWSSGHLVVDHLGNPVLAPLAPRDAHLEVIAGFLGEGGEFLPPSAPPLPRGQVHTQGRFDLAGDRLVAPGTVSSRFTDFGTHGLADVRLMDRTAAIFGGDSPALTSHHSDFTRALVETAQHFYGPGADTMIRLNDLARLRDLAFLLGAEPGRALPGPDFFTARLREVFGGGAVEPRAVEGLARMAEWITETGDRLPSEPGVGTLHRVAGRLLGQSPWPEVTHRAAHLFSDAAERSPDLAEGRGTVNYPAAGARLQAHAPRGTTADALAWAANRGG